MEIILRGNPLSTNSIYRHARGISYITKKGRELKNEYARQVSEQYKKSPVDYDLEILVMLYFGDKRRRDWDNYHKLSMDALNGTVWVDDSQIQKATVFKGYDNINPRIELQINKYDRTE